MNLFLTISVLLGLTAVFGVINERYLRLPSAIGLMFLAILATVVVAVLKATGVMQGYGVGETIARELNLSDVLLNGVLCFMLFTGSAAVKIDTLRENKWVIYTLAIGATLLAWILTGVMIWWILGLLGVGIPLAYAFVFGALISPTDPIAALAILKSVGLPKSLEAIINGESLFNDGVGVVLFTMSLTIAAGTTQVSLADGVTLFFREVIGGVGLGLLVGFVTHIMLLRSKEYGNQLMITLATVSLGYSVALQIEVSGPIAMVVTGLFVY